MDGDLAHRRGDVGLGRELGHELLDLPFRPVRRASEEGVTVGLREVRGDPGDAASVTPFPRRAFRIADTSLHPLEKHSAQRKLILTLPVCFTTHHAPPMALVFLTP